MRWSTPLFLAAVTGAVFWYNGAHGSSQLVFPGAWLLPGAEGDIAAQGQWSWRLLGFVTLITVLTSGIEQVRAWRRRDERLPKP